MPEDLAPRPPPDDITSLADTLIRRLFTVSMDLHQALARLSTLDGDRHPSHQQRHNGRAGRPTAPARADGMADHQEAERLRETLGKAIGELDEQIHDIRSLVAHTITPHPADAPGEHGQPADPNEPGELNRPA